MSITNKRKQYIIVFVVTVVAVIIYLFSHHVHIVQPIAIEMDKAIDNFIQLTAITEEWNMQANVLSVCEYNIQNIIMLLLVKICGNVWAGINIYYIFTFFMISFSMYYFLTKLEVPIQISVGLAVLAAFMPFHIDRGEGQMITSNFFLAPLFMSMFYDWIYCRKLIASKRYMILICLAPFIDIRISVMVCIIFCFLLIQRKDRELARFVLRFFVPFLLLCGFVCMLASTLKLDDIQTAKQEGMRILDLVMPMRYHAIGRLSDIRLSYDITLSAHGESGLNSLGILFSFGFVYMMFGMFFERKKDSCIAWMGMICIFAFLMAGICGLGSVLDYFGVHVIYWSRMAVFFVVCSIATIGIFIGNIYNNIGQKYGKRIQQINCVFIYMIFILEFFELIIRRNM